MREAGRAGTRSSGLMGVEGRVQRKGEVVHVIAYRLRGFSEELRGVEKADTAFSLPRGRGD